MNYYYGDAPLCYSNSLAMVLNAYGYNYSTEYLEALMVMGNGASFIDDNAKHPLVFFDNGLPDRSISNCLQTLGFGYEAFYLEDSKCYNKSEIKDKLIVRNLYMSQFLKDFDIEKANLKGQIAALFGQAHLDSMKEDYTILADTLLEISKLDEHFKALCLRNKGE